MKIDKDKQLHLLDNLSKSSSTKQKTEVAGPRVGRQNTDTTDKVELSGFKAEVERLKEKVKTAPVIREDKVQEMREALKNETYNVRGELVARSMLKSNLLDEIL
jgi:flagellar biosynthesis anti-sigma factor FlgM